ncbi:MAG: hypothetical protein B7Z58_01005 [Acidiphilium sp. 37-64-53]|uniref:hypothetical protein n=1 Tax=Acidiphilium TaxID=522 RepID=UPI000BC903D5|nr:MULTISPECIES: hypothetical protein [Acidiphilium]OYW04178.1 MAG: hypothetical protein B7Z58_01005 [Acidiphilium sp. 37-64-53]HQT83426.1 hypothetical protein [Acidiphilium rubrum]
MDHSKTGGWRGGISFAIIDDLSQDAVVAIVVETPSGVIKILAEPDFHDRSLVLRRTHMQGPRANLVGAGNLMALAQVMMERLDCDEIIVEGAVRTTGAHPGHAPRILRFARRRGVATIG